MNLFRLILESEDFERGYHDITFVERKIEYYKCRKELEEIPKELWYSRSDGQNAPSTPKRRN